MRRLVNQLSLRVLATLVAGLAVTLSGLAQEPGSETPRAFTAADYQQAEKFMGYNTNPLLFRSDVRPTWLLDERFWYRNTIADGSEFILVDPRAGSREPAFDHTRLASALSGVSATTYLASDLPFDSFEFTNNDRNISFSIDDRAWTCDVEADVCSPDRPTVEGRRGRGRGAVTISNAPSVLSPDGQRATFIREHNLWVREIATGEERQVTRDGGEDYGYATDNAGWRKSDRPIVLWSPDSKKIATFQQDQRGVGEMFLVDTRVGHPNLEVWKYPLPGDAVVTMIERVVIDIDTGSVVRLSMPPDQHRSSLCDDVVCRGGWGDVQWSQDGTTLAFLSTSRDHRQQWLRVADTTTGEVRQVLDEAVSTFYESGNGAINWRYLPESNEVIWFSERDNWGHLYLYDLETGALKSQITRGPGNLTRLLRVDAERRLLYFLGVGFEDGRDPYFTHLYRIGLDGGDPVLLTPEDANHNITLSPSGEFFVDTYSTPDIAPVAVTRDAAGNLKANLEEADISRLLETGWKPPVSFTVKARDGETDLYGLMFRPTTFDPERKYPIINSIYPGPQTGSVGSRNFSAARGDAQAIAELGFIVVKLDGMGTPWRSKEFHDRYYGDMGDNTLPDQVTGMEQLAERFSWIDLERTGIYGHSGGGYATAGAMFHYPDFFKVGVSQAGNHDNRVYEDDWGEKWQGLLTRNADGETNYDNQANQNFARNLKGKLLLAHGTMDTNVPFYGTLLVVDALIEANKDFDLILLPNRSHDFGNEPYMVRRRWDYFVRHLLGAEPPVGYEIKPPEQGSR
jgi:dipeptidyl-peptidase-4